MLWFDFNLNLKQNKYFSTIWIFHFNSSDNYKINCSSLNLNLYHTQSLLGMQEDTQDEVAQVEIGWLSCSVWNEFNAPADK